MKLEILKKKLQWFACGCLLGTFYDETIKINAHHNDSVAAKLGPAQP